MTALVELAIEDGAAIVTLNRPDRLNAWTGQMHLDVKAAMRAASTPSLSAAGGGSRDRSSPNTSRSSLGTPVMASFILWLCGKIRIDT